MTRRLLPRIALVVALLVAPASVAVSPTPPGIAPDHARSQAAARQRWLRQAVLYGVIPDRLAPGGARGLATHLDELRGLYDGLLLAPINKTVDYGYAVTDHFALRPEFGTEADLRELVRAAHRRGMRVLMDVALNHTSDQHPFYLDAERRGRASPYYDFYDRDAAGRATHYFDWRHLPNLNYANPDVQRLMIRVLCYWVRVFDVDGFRLDAAWAVQERNAGFWPRAASAVREVKPSALLIAEATARDRYWQQSGFDAAYDWTERPGRWAWEKVFDERDGVPLRLQTALVTSAAAGPEGVAVLRFLNNNDTGARFVTRHGPAMTRAASALLLTLPGLPLVFLGDEVGAEFEPYASPAGHISHKDRHQLRRHYQRLIDLRRRVPALQSERWRPLPVRRGQSTFGYLRYSDEARESAVLVLLNFGDAATVTLQMPAGFERFAQRPLYDLLSGERLERELGSPGSARVPMRPFSVRVLALRLVGHGLVSPSGVSSSAGSRGSPDLRDSYASSEPGSPSSSVSSSVQDQRCRCALCSPAPS